MVLQNLAAGEWRHPQQRLFVFARMVFWFDWAGGRVVGQSSLLAFLNERLLSATSGHRIDFKDRALMINKSVALPDQIFARPELA